MSELDPDSRISISEVKNHPWYVQECTINDADIKDIFTKRFDTLNKELIAQSTTAESAS
jgi:hypothetical protein